MLMIQINERNSSFEKHLTNLILTLNSEIVSVKYEWSDNVTLRSIRIREKNAKQYETINCLGFDLTHAAIQVLRKI